MVERVARALWFDSVDQQGYPNGQPTWDEMLALPTSDRNNRCEEFRSLARAAIAAMREPTEAMKLAGALAILPDSDVLPVTSKEAGDAFAAMIDTALAAAEGGGDG